MIILLKLHYGVTEHQQELLSASILHYTTLHYTYYCFEAMIPTLASCALIYELSSVIQTTVCLLCAKMANELLFVWTYFYINLSDCDKSGLSLK